MPKWRQLPLVLCLFALAGAFGPPAAADPPGNNGTIKIDGVAFDQHPNNQPHVGCVFQVDFYGFDQGAFNATVTFRGHPPTGGGVLLSDTVFIGEDPAGGGTDLDAEVTYDLSAALAGIAPHPVQGHHVKLTVNAPGSQGADTKHKVFWVRDCPKPPPPPPHGEADLIVHKDDSPDPVRVGDELTYLISVTNRGPDVATNVQLTDPLPASVSFVSVTSSQGTCGFSGGVVSCDLGSLSGARGNAKVTIKVVPLETGTIWNRVTVSADQTDPTPRNSNSESTTVIAR
jgi:uncharacterized repeat protein (TIGR01451 family)